MILDGVAEREASEARARAASEPPVPAVRRAKVYTQRDAARKAEVEGVIREELLRDPRSEIARAYLHERYGLAAGPAPPLGAPLGAPPPPDGRPLGGAATISAGKLLPAKTTVPKPAPERPGDEAWDDESEAGEAPDEGLLATGEGVYNLMTRGAIARGADLGASLGRQFSTTPATLHVPLSRYQRQTAGERGGGSTERSAFGGVHTLRLDPQYADAEVGGKTAIESEAPYAGAASGGAGDAGSAAKSSGAANHASGGGDIAAARGFEALQDAYSLHQFMIRKGVTLEKTPEFASFQRAHSNGWSAIAALIERMEDICGGAGVNVVLVDGKRLAALAAERSNGMGGLEPDQRHNVDVALVSCVANESARERLARAIGAEDAVSQAAADALAAADQERAQRAAEEASRLEAAVRVQRAWRLHAERLVMRRRIVAARAARRARFAELQGRFFAQWDEVQASRRVLVHVPSLPRGAGGGASGRNGGGGGDEARVREGGFMSRLCCVADPDVECVLVTPGGVDDDVLQYYLRLLDAGGVADAAARVCVASPELAPRLPAGLSLAQQLLSSPRALRRVRAFCRGREAYLVPAESAPEALELCVALDIPMLAPDPALAAHFSRRATARDVFGAAKVNVAPGATLGAGAGAERELYGALAGLMLEHPRTARWLLKLDDGARGLGHLYVDVAAIKPAADILAVAAQAPRRYAAGAAGTERAGACAGLEAALARHMPRRAVVVRPHAHVGEARGERLREGAGAGGGQPLAYRGFMLRLARTGGVLEAAPNEVTGSPSVNLLVEPTGVVRVLSTHEPVFCPPYVCVGAAFPQSSAPHRALAAAAEAVGAACFSVGVFGYVGVDFVTLREAGVLRLWAVDLDLRQPDSQVAFDLFDFIAQGVYDAESGAYRVADEAGEQGLLAAMSEAQYGGGALPEARAVSTSRRFYAAAHYASHPAIASMQYSTLMHDCRVENVTYDLAAKQGVAFHLFDSLAAGALGVLSVAREPRQALAGLARALDFTVAQVEALTGVGQIHVAAAAAADDEAPPSLPEVHGTLRFLSQAMDEAGVDAARAAEAAAAQ